MKRSELKEAIKAEIKSVLKEEIDINKISKLGDYNETEDSYKYKDHFVQKYIDGGKTIYAVFKDKGEKTDSYGSPDFESSDLKKVEDFLTKNKLSKEEEFKLYTTNVEYDTGEDGYMYQLVDAETGEENEIGFDQLHFDRDDNLLQLGVDFNDYEQTSYQEEEVSAEKAMKIYNELK